MFFLLDFFHFLTPINIAIVYVLISVSAMVEEQLPKAFIRSPSPLSVGGDQVWSKTKTKTSQTILFSPIFKHSRLFKLKIFFKEKLTEK